MNTINKHVLSDGELRCFHEVLLDMLLEINRICKKNDIKYCLLMGTMLGAVRHNGFIPWDDDADIAMTRNEYEKFKEACKRDLNQEKYFYQDHTTDPFYRWGYARIRRINSEFIRLGQEHMKMKTGIFIDVFPHDSTPDCFLFRALHCFYCYVLRKILYSEIGRKTSKTFVVRVWYSMINVIPHSWVLRRVEKLAKTNKKTKMLRILTFPTPKNKPFGYLRKWLEELNDIEFEGHMLPGVKDYDNYLKYQYGDYMTVPPPEKQTSCHPAARFRLPCDGK